MRYELDSTAGAGHPVSSALTAGQQFDLTVYVQDIESSPKGVYQFFCNVNYPSLVSPANGTQTKSAVTLYSSYSDDTIIPGTFDFSQSGQIANAGASTDGVPLPNGKGAEYPVFSVPMVANQSGTFAPDPNTFIVAASSTHAQVIIGLQSVSWSDIVVSGFPSAPAVDLNGPTVSGDDFPGERPVSSRLP